jgi:large subunit ribosomal protein L5
MYISRLEKQYKEIGARSLVKKLGLSNPMRVPKMQKIVISMSTSDAVADTKVIDRIFDNLFLIAGQKPVVTKAKKSIASFKLREGMKLGVKVTLRRTMMYEFIDRLVNVALPRSRDFKGLSSKQFDGNGNYSLGIKEHIIFPEIDYNKVDKIRGFGIVFVTNSAVDKHAQALFETFNLPFLD